MKRLISRSIYFLCLLIVFTACEDQELTFLPSGQSAFPSADRVEASFYGRLLNQKMEPVINAEVWIGDRMALSDSLGDWIIPRIDVVSRQVYVKVEADDYFPASRVLSVLPSSMNLVRIMPTLKQDFEAIQSSAGGEVHLPDGSSLTFQSGSFVDELTGDPYDGEVRVYAYYIDGQSESSQVQMPGRLESTTEEAALVSFGMMVTDLETPSGRPLQLAEGMPATIRYEQAQLDGNAPDTIPLWHFDEGIGTWVKEGFSVREGNAYVGEVAHFTWWNCDWPEDLVDFCVQFTCTDTDSIPSIAGRSNSVDYCLEAVIDFPNFSSRGVSASLDEDLKYCDVLPANATVTFSLIREDGTLISFGPFSTGSEEIDFGVHEVDCSVLDPDCAAVFPNPPRPPGQVNPPTQQNPPTPPPPVTATLVWSPAECENVGESFLLRIASTAGNSFPIVLDRPMSEGGSVTVTLPSSNTVIVSILDPDSGEVIGRKRFSPAARMDLGIINTTTGIFDATGYEVKGRLQGCDAGLSGVTVRLLSPEGSLIDETQSSPSGIFKLNTTSCDGRGVSVSILLPEGEQIMAAELFADFDFGDISVCAADGNYYWRAKVNGQQYSYLTCNGRAGSDGWVAYAATEPNPTAPFFGIVHSGQVVNARNFAVGPDLPVKFNGFRLGQYSFTPSSHPFEGELKVLEFGTVASGTFTGTCVNSDGETIELEVEMRFVKP